MNKRKFFINEKNSKSVFIKNLSMKFMIGFSSLGIADYVCQHLEVMNKTPLEKIDKDRLIRNVSWGFLGVPLTVANLYLFNRFFKVVGLKTLLINLFLAQFYFSSMHYFFFFIYMNMYKGRSFKESFADMQSKFYKIWFDNGKFWPFVNIVNYYFLPYSYRFYFLQSASLMWNIYLSYYLNRNNCVNL